MSPTRLTARLTARPTIRRPTRIGGAAALAVGGLLLTGACGTVHAGAEPATSSAIGTSSAVAPGSVAPGSVAPAAPAPVAPAPAPRSSRVRTPLPLPVTAASTGGAITGTVSSGELGCLFVRTDAGQVFSLAGGEGRRLRQLLPATSLTSSPTGVLTTPGVVTNSAGSSGVRISAAGTLRAAPSFCGASYTFTIATVRVESQPLR